MGKLGSGALDEARIREALGAAADGFTIRVADVCESTNSLLLDDPPADNGRVHVVVAETQTAGRGRRGREWLSWHGASLTFSTLWRFAPGAPVPAGLSLVAGLALARTLEKLGADDIQLKWPNDVLVGGAKLAGILVEILPGRASSVSAVVGVGINVALPESADVPDQIEITDLATVLDAPPDRNSLLAQLLRELSTLFETYQMAGFGALRGAWEQRNAHAGLMVSVGGEAEDAQGRCLGVDDDGALLLETGEGQRRILSGEVSLRPSA